MGVGGAKNNQRYQSNVRSVNHKWMSYLTSDILNGNGKPRSNIWKNNFKRPEDALAEKHPVLTDWQLEIKRC